MNKSENYEMSNQFKKRSAISIKWDMLPECYSIIIIRGVIVGFRFALRYGF